jgi:GxxExxY protein
LNWLPGRVREGENNKFEDLTEQIIGCAYDVFNRFNYGFLEEVYERGLEIELEKRGLQVERQIPLTVHYDDHVVGEYIADVLVENIVLLELKSVEKLHDRHEVQLVSHLNSTNTDVGLEINFGPEGVEVKRSIRDLPE